MSDARLGPDYRPNKFALSNSEVEATGILAGGAVQNIARELIAAREQLERLRWRPITEQDLPKVGDELLSMPSMHIQSIAADPVMQYGSLVHFCYTYFRPIDPPQTEEEAQR